MSVCEVHLNLGPEILESVVLHLNPGPGQATSAGCSVAIEALELMEMESSAQNRDSQA
jgi:hypothetical protein